MSDEKYHYPAVTVDILLIGYDDRDLKILLIERKNPPFQGHWAFPGGFIEIGECLVESAVREMHEETSVELNPSEVKQFFTAGDPGRDPRGRTISVCYLAFCRSDNVNPQAADDARSLQWFNISEPPPLAFDHQAILQIARQSMKERLLLTPSDMLRKLLPATFTLPQFQRLIELITGATLNTEQLDKLAGPEGYIKPVAGKTGAESLFEFTEGKAHEAGLLLFLTMSVLDLGVLGLLFNPFSK